MIRQDQETIIKRMILKTAFVVVVYCLVLYVDANK